MTATIDEFNASISGALGEVTRRLQPLLDRGLPGSEGRMWKGHPVWFYGEEPLAGYRAYPGYVALMFWQGQQFDDPEHLQPESGNMAVMKYAGPDEIDEAAVLDWARQAAALAGDQLQ
jgi:hypothetical protein